MAQIIGQTYSDRVARLFQNLDLVFRNHPVHHMIAGPLTLHSMTDTAAATCECTVDDRCELLNQQIVTLIARSFPPSDADLFDIWSAQLFDIDFDDPVHTVRSAISEALIRRATTHLFPDGAVRPVDPHGAEMSANVGSYE